MEQCLLKPFIMENESQLPEDEENLWEPLDDHVCIRRAGIHGSFVLYADLSNRLYFVSLDKKKIYTGIRIIDSKFSLNQYYKDENGNERIAYLLQVSTFANGKTKNVVYEFSMFNNERSTIFNIESINPFDKSIPINIFTDEIHMLIKTRIIDDDVIRLAGIDYLNMIFNMGLKNYGVNPIHPWYASYYNTYPVIQALKAKDGLL